MNYPSHGYSGDSHDDPRLVHASEGLRRQAALPTDRSSSALGSEGSSPFMELGGHNFSPNGSNYDMSGNTIGGPSTGKGSRFAKFFDAKNRDIQPAQPLRKPQGPGLLSTSPLPGPRQEQIGLNGAPPHINDNRTMEDLFAMLQNSTQASTIFG